MKHPAVVRAALALALSSAASGATLYVATNSPADGPGSAWSNAFHTIQTAVNEAPDGCLVLVSNGIYDAGGASVAPGALTNRVAATNAIFLQSVQGPAVTVIEGFPSEGADAVRCVYLANGARMTGFTLTSGAARVQAETDLYGGGAFLDQAAVLSNCVVSGNAAVHGGGIFAQNGARVLNSVLSGNIATGGLYSAGGGLECQYACLVSDCLISNNSAAYSGGGIQGLLTSVVRRCTVRNNWGRNGGGVLVHSDSVAENCLILHNAAVSAGGLFFSYGGIARNCTIVRNGAENAEYAGALFWYGGLCYNSIISSNGSGDTYFYSGGQTYSCHVAADPLFADYAAGDYRLASNSPCVDAGQDLPESAADLDRVARPLDGNHDGTNRWDIGCYEYLHPESDSDGDSLRDTNEVALGTNPTLTDTDGDDSGDGIEVIRAGTDPLDSSSVFRLEGIRYLAGAGPVVQWQSASNKSYRLERAAALLDAFSPVASNLAAHPPISAGTDTTAAAAGFYRMALE